MANFIVSHAALANKMRPLVNIRVAERIQSLGSKGELKVTKERALIN